MADRIGIQMGPEVFEMLFRAGAEINTKEGLKILLAENGVPRDLVMQDCGFNNREGQFFFIFAEKGDKTPGPIHWRAPVYERAPE